MFSHLISDRTSTSAIVVALDVIAALTVAIKPRVARISQRNGIPYSLLG